MQPSFAPLMLDVAGPELTTHDRRRLLHPRVGGVIHFGRNWASRAQMLALNTEIKALRPDLLIAVDHEGGRVQRFRTDGFTRLPPMRALGQLFAAEAARERPGTAPLRALQAAQACGFVLASELRACGVDLSFAPVLDLDWGGSTVIGDRAFSADARVVAVLAQQLTHGLRLAGMAHCGKHFPGHGFVRADSHTDVPVDRRSLKAILADDAQPYRWLMPGLAAVMPAHVIYPRVDTLPTGFSVRWLQQILRGDMGFGGAIFSDDLSMAAARQVYGKTITPLQAVRAALHAGCDLALLCNQSVVADGAPLDTVLEGLMQTRSRATAAWPWPDAARCAASEQRRRALLPLGPALDWPALQSDHRYQQSRQLLRQCGLLAAG